LFYGRRGREAGGQSSGTGTEAGTSGVEITRVRNRKKKRKKKEEERKEKEERRKNREGE